MGNIRYTYEEEFGKEILLNELQVAVDAARQFNAAAAAAASTTNAVTLITTNVIVPAGNDDDTAGSEETI